MVNNGNFIPADFQDLISTTSLGQKTLIELCDDGNIVFQAHDFELADPIRYSMIIHALPELFQDISRRKQPDVICDYILKNLDNVIGCLQIPFIDDILGNDIRDCNVFRRIQEGSFSYKYCDLLRLLDMILQKTDLSYRLALYEYKRQQELNIWH